MSTPLDALVPEMLTLGHQLNSRFDGALFRTIAEGAAAKLWAHVEGSEGDETLLRSYLRLVVEATGMGCLAKDPGGAHRNLLSLALLDLAPENLAAFPPGVRPHVLAFLWNVGEGLLAEPAWMNRYAAAMCADVTDLNALSYKLEAVLEPVLAPRAPSRWAGPHTVKVLDPRSVRDDFLPGAMHLAAPSVVCLHDRRAPKVHLGVMLDHGGRSAILGMTPCLGGTVPETAIPAVEFTPNAVKIADRAVALPWLRAPRDQLVTATGFVLATAVDSQRLWVIDTP
ncbi:MAG: hypothetical protein U0326_31570 [Polyangiales bacterium]